MNFKGAFNDVALSMCDLKLSIKLCVVKDLVEGDFISETEADIISLKYHNESMEERKRIREFKPSGENNAIR